MDSDTVQPVKRRPYLSFIALLYSLSGWALFDAWLFLMDAGHLMHIFVAIPGATLTIWSALRPPIDGSSTVEGKRNRATKSGRVGASCALLYVLAAILGTLVLNGSLAVLGAAIVSLTFAPWARLPFSRNHFAISCVIAISGLASVIAIGHRSVNVMFLPLAAWAFWLCACCVLLLSAERLRRARHEKNVTSDTVKIPPRPVHYPG